MDKIINQPIEEELKEWRELKSWLMDYPCDEDDAKFNKMIEDAPARAIVKYIKGAHIHLKNQVEFYKNLTKDLTK